MLGCGNLYGKSIQTSASYTGNGNRLASVTDAAGASVTYSYGDANSQMMGLPTSVTDSYGTVTTSAYDANGRVTQTSVADCANLLYTYSSGSLSTVKRTDSSNNAQTYGFTYDSFGNMLTARVGNKTLAAYTYGAGNGLLTKQTYANGDSVSFTYDVLGRVKTAVYGDGRKLTYTYNGEGQLHSVTEEGSGSSPVTYLYTYDSLGRLISSEQKEGAISTLRTSQTYNENNQLTKQGWQMGSTAYAESYTYNTSDGSLNTMTTGVGTTLTMGYDGLRRLTSVSGGPVTRQYTYRDISGTQTTMQVASVTSGDYTYGYTYDAMGNIATYTAPGQNPVTYTYDDQGQLLGATGNDSYSYTYDTVGNILTASRGSSTHSYTYGNTDWKDLLTAFDGETITYDASGNPLSYYNGTRWAFTWSNGRRLTQASASGTTVDYTYNLDGLRTNKTVDGVAHNYLYAGGKLMRETYGSNTLDFFYDANGIPYTLKYNGAVYYYITNLQGDVTYLVDTNGSAAATYEYDPYGNIITATGTLAQINPLRYRGYYYDNETGLYYLQSRYYDPAVGRFINADSLASTGQGVIGCNMFAYCSNNPIDNIDLTGEFAITITTLILLGSIATGVGFAGYTAYREYQAGCDTIQIVGDSICAGLSAFFILYTGGMSLYQCYLNYCNLNAITPVTEVGTKVASTTSVDLFRAVSPEEYTSTIASQKFSSSANSYADSKFFATSYDDAAMWGSRMYRNDPYAILKATMDVSVLTSPGTQYWERLDGIGPAYLIPNNASNHFVISIK